ncbi:MAG: flagellar M-ring protein FliF C-terminal domain-containing protein [Solirubrobacteraceae bacterium]|jgi:flagellar M-ring protein FliF
MPLREIINKLTVKSWIMVGASIAGGLILITILMQMASAPSYSTLLTGISPAQTGKMTAALSTQGIPYQLQNGGTALAVPASDVASARIALASDDLLTTSESDSSLFSGSSLGESDTQQQIQYQVDLEQQLADTIDQVQGVSGAQVEIALPNANNEVFATTTQQPSAAVLLSGGSSLDSGAIRGIAQLVASSVQGLSINKVTITSDTGELLWPNGSGGNGSGALESAESSFDQQQEASISGMLATTLGANMATVVVDAQLNDNQETVDSVTYGKTAVPLSTSTQNETLTNKGGSGTTTVANGQTASGNSNYKNTTSSSTNGVDKQVTQETIAPGQVLSDNVAVLLSKKVPSSEVGSIKTAVEAAVGASPSLISKGIYNVQVNQVPFAKTATTTATGTGSTGSSSGMMGMAQDAIAAIGGIIFLFLMTRALRRREREPIAARQATWLRELDSPRSLIELEDETRPVEPVRVKRLRPAAGSPAKIQVEDLVEHEPERVATQVREWMSEE